MILKIKSTVFLLMIFSSVSNSLHAQEDQLKTLLSKQRLIIIMFDGFGKSYYKNAPMPFLKKMAQNGLYKEVDALMPTVTNLNNSAICTGSFASTNGITGNSFLNAEQVESYMETANLVLAPTLFQLLQSKGIKSALLASKKKSIGLLSAGTTVALSPEMADSTSIHRLGTPPSIYSVDVNYWTMNAAVDILKNRQDIRCVYIHTTDYPMHMWAPEDINSINHLSTIDQYLEQFTKIAPDAMILITADHDVNHKSRCIDIEKKLATKNVQIKIALSVEKDKYPKHHRGFGGTSYVYLNKGQNEPTIKKYLMEMNGVKSVLTKKEAAMKFHLMESRIGDLVVLADSNTVFGTLEAADEELLPENYRSHGSEFEIKVPLIMYNVPPSMLHKTYQFNKDITSWLFKLN